MLSLSWDVTVNTTVHQLLSSRADLMADVWKPEERDDVGGCSPLHYCCEFTTLLRATRPHQRHEMRLALLNTRRSMAHSSFWRRVRYRQHIHWPVQYSTVFIQLFSIIVSIWNKTNLLTVHVCKNVFVWAWQTYISSVGHCPSWSLDMAVGLYISLSVKSMI